MTRHKRIFIVDIQTLAKRQKSGNDKCLYCGQPIMVGDKVISNKNRHKSPIRHFSCYIKSFVR